MSFNIRYANPGDGANRWELRRDLAFTTIRNYDPDILCLQEALKPQLDDILSAFPGYAHAGVGRDDGKSAGEYAAILYRRERFAAWSDSTFWLSDTPQLPGSKSWGNNVTRICTFVELTDQSTMQAVTVFNTHLDHESQPAREKGVELICAYLDRCKGPYILAGDFNMGRDNPAMQKLLAIRKWQKPPWPAGKKEPCWVVVDGPPRVIDSYRVVHGVGGIEGTYHAFTGRTEGERIDFIFIERLLPAWRFSPPTSCATMRTAAILRTIFPSPPRSRCTCPAAGGDRNTNARSVADPPPTSSPMHRTFASLLRRVSVTALFFFFLCACPAQAQVKAALPEGASAQTRIARVSRLRVLRDGFLREGTAVCRFRPRCGRRRGARPCDGSADGKRGHGVHPALCRQGTLRGRRRRVAFRVALLRDGFRGASAGRASPRPGSGALSRAHALRGRALPRFREERHARAARGSVGFLGVQHRGQQLHQRRADVDVPVHERFALDQSRHGAVEVPLLRVAQLPGEHFRDRRQHQSHEHLAQPGGGCVARARAGRACLRRRVRGVQHVHLQ
ncbi:MAG: endonuclease/exonuclease/phosphatase family protein [Ignavibacteria bacterium]|nr:endonuclease/exonuclease/phosphatase family protein [Ignavibacteria bacterium]